MSELAIAILLGAIAAGTPLLFAACGELVVERAGVLNLGVEGMMLVGALAAFATVASGGGYVAAFAAGAAAGGLLALVFATATLTCQANQVATGLAIAIFGQGLAAFAGKPYTSATIEGLKAQHGVDPMPAVALAVLVAVAWFLYRTRAGLLLRAIGESPAAAHELGHPVIAIRYAATLFGGAMAGVGGAYLSVVYTPLWVEGLVAGRGWIALALVVFATWRPERLLVGAYLFGGVTVAQFHAQGHGVALPPQLLAALPYLATIVVLVLISRDPRLARMNAPAALGQPFHPRG